MLGVLVAAAVAAGLVVTARRDGTSTDAPAVLPPVATTRAEVGATGSTGPPRPTLADALAGARPASGRFEGWTEARVALGERCLRVVLADQGAERGQGLRGVSDLSPYDGMVFVYPGDVETPFTMARVPVDLDITWYDAAGAPLDGTRMQACPDGTDETCPLYRSSRRFRLALETPAGGHGPGALGGCAA